jgi:hypothetical protein
MPHYALVMDDGDAIGPVELEGGEAEWPSGRIIERVYGPDLRVVGYLQPETPENFGVFVVELV